ncbi:MAG: mechanosensitive ion channel family protein [Candidatus Accumulibacter sp.]|jgi:MscS family membrane protein|nr:mechanosensitive ion channel family protein [Accumulibacter sp.]
MKRFEIWLTKLTDGDEAAILGLHILLIVLAIVIFNFVARRVLLRFSKIDSAMTTNTLLELSVVAAARQPLLALAWVVGISFAGQLVQGRTDAAILAVVHPVRTIGVIACLGWFLVRFIGNAKEVLIERWIECGEDVDRTTAEAISQLLRIAVLIATFLVALQSLGFSIEGVLAFGGIGGIAIGFAAKDLLANFFGSLMIYFDRPFAVGDWIRSPDRQIEGTVEAIGWRLTRIRTPDKRPLYVPNSVFATIAVENPSRMTHRRINEIVGVRYDDIGEVAGIAEDIRAMLRAHPGIDPDQNLVVNFSQFNESSLDITIYAFTRATTFVEFHEVKQDALLKIAGIIDRHGAQVAFPTRVNYVVPFSEDRK